MRALAFRCNYKGKKKKETNLKERGKINVYKQ